jgi:hypothetical protein
MEEIEERKEELGKVRREMENGAGGVVGASLFGGGGNGNGGGVGDRRDD